MPFNPVVSFHFEVSFPKKEFTTEDDLLFSEVSGLDMEIETVAVKEGGVNDTLLQLPGRSVYKDVVMKRAMVAKSSELYSWFQKTIRWEKSKSEKIKPAEIDVDLLDEEGNSCAKWKILGAYPKKVTISDMNAKASGESAIMIETLSFAHKGIERIN